MLELEQKLINLQQVCSPLYRKGFISDSSKGFIACWQTQMFLDMAVLVDAQGDLLDNIETQV